MITKKKLCIAVLFNHSSAQNMFFFHEGGAFKNIQGLLWKIQGLFKAIPQFFNFPGLFKDMMLFRVLFKAHVNHVRRLQT